MHSYTVYGLAVHSAVEFTELAPSVGPECDVIIRFGPVERSLSEICAGGQNFLFTNEAAYFHWDRIGTFRVRQGTEITIDRHQEADERCVRAPLLGVLLAVLLHQRGIWVLHASAVSVSGRGVAFLGEKGMGKSTAAAALYARGHRLLADDLVPLTVDAAGHTLVLPGYAQLKLWPEAAASVLGDDPETLPLLLSRETFPGYTKRVRGTPAGFQQEPLPLAGIYVLERGTLPGITPLKPQDALVELIRHSYVARFGSQMLSGTCAERHFRRCADLANTVPVCRLRRRTALDELPDLAASVEIDLLNRMSGNGIDQPLNFRHRDDKEKLRCPTGSPGRGER